MSKRVLIATGGTGGHIFPAVALAHELRKSNINVLFVGGGLETNRYFDRTDFLYQSIACGSIVKKNPKALLKATVGIGKGVFQSLRIMKSYQPNLVVGFGSFYSFPALLGAKIASIPIVLHEANSIPGKVIRLMSPYATATGIHFPHTAQLLKGKIEQVGLPLRPNFKKNICTKEEARSYFQLDSEKFTVLIFGGSQGANVINFLASEVLMRHPFQVLHFTGDAGLADSIQAKYRAMGISSAVKPFEKQMEMAWCAADAVIARAGAGTIAEQLEFEIPGILIPFPQAADNHQEFNADFMVSIGGGIKLLEKQLTPESLAYALRQISAQQEEMCLSMQAYKRQMEHQNLFSLVRRNLSQ